MTFTHDHLAALTSWLVTRADLCGVGVTLDTDLDAPVRVNRTAGHIWVRPDLDDRSLHWWVSRATAFVDLGPRIITDFAPPIVGNVIPLRRRR